MMKLEYDQTTTFAKDFKKLLKKYKSLKEDLETAKKNAIELYHVIGLDNKSIFPIPGFQTQEIAAYKIRKFACKSLKGSGVMSGIRIIYAFHKSSQKIVFIEMYHKNDKATEDKDRLKLYFHRHLS